MSCRGAPFFIGCVGTGTAEQAQVQPKDLIQIQRGLPLLFLIGFDQIGSVLRQKVYLLVSDGVGDQGALIPELTHVTGSRKKFC